MLGEHDNINLAVKQKKEIYLQLFGIFYITIIGVIIGAGMLYLNNLPMFSKNNLLPVTFAADTVKVERELPLVKGTISAPVDVMKLSVSTPELVEKGKTLFTTNCTGCHGNEGKGDGVAGVNLNPKPRNFHELSGWTNGPKVWQIYKTLQEGILTRGMASYANLPSEDRFALIAFIRSLNPDYPKDSEEDLKQLDKTYSLSAGVKMPNQMPVKMAMEKLLQENKTGERIKALDSAIINNRVDTGAVMIRKITINQVKALTLLTVDSSWNVNEKAFVDLVDNNFINNGFKPDVLTLTPGELTNIYRYLKNLFNSYKP